MLLQPTKRTVAEALLGLTVAILQILGAERVELQAQDEGSGRLVNFYERAGFTKVMNDEDRTPDSMRKQWTRMEGPASVVAQLAPEAWLVDLVPKDFLPAKWTQQCTTILWQDRMLSGRLPRLEWAVKWPSAANLSVTVVKCKDPAEPSEGLLIDVQLTNMRGRQIAHGQAVAMIGEDLLWVLQLACGAGHGWLLVYSLPEAREGQGRIPSDSRVAPAVAVLGLLASIAQWFGAAVLRLQPLEQGVGKMMHYFKDIGFASMSPAVASAMQGPAGVLGGVPYLEAPCAQLAMRWCPTEWSNQLTRAEDVHRFQGASRVQQLPQSSLARRHGHDSYIEASGIQQE